MPMPSSSQANDQHRNRIARGRAARAPPPASGWRCDSTEPAADEIDLPPDARAEHRRDHQRGGERAQRSSSRRCRDRGRSGSARMRRQIVARGPGQGLRRAERQDDRKLRAGSFPRDSGCGGVIRLHLAGSVAFAAVHDRIVKRGREHCRPRRFRTSRLRGIIGRMQLHAPALRLMNWLVAPGTYWPARTRADPRLLRALLRRGHSAVARARLDRHAAPDLRGPRLPLERCRDQRERKLSSMARPSEGDAAEGWRRSVFYDMLEQGHEQNGGRPRPTSTSHRLSRSIDELAEKGHKHFAAFVHRFGEAGTMGQMDCVYSYWTTRRDSGFGEEGLAALRDLVPVLGLAIKSAAQADITRTLGRVYLGREPPSRCCADESSRGVTEKINAVLWFSDLRGSTAISEKHRARRDHPVPQRLCAGLDRRDPRCRRRGAEADRRRRAGDVHQREHGDRQARGAACRASCSATTWTR